MIAGSTCHNNRHISVSQMRSQYSPWKVGLGKYMYIGAEMRENRSYNRGPKPCRMCSSVHRPSGTCALASLDTTRAWRSKPSSSSNLFTNVVLPAPSGPSTMNNFAPFYALSLYHPLLSRATALFLHWGHLNPRNNRSGEDIIIFTKA